MNEKIAKLSRFLGYGITFLSSYLKYKRDWETFGIEELEIMVVHNKEVALQVMILVAIISAADFFQAFTKYKLPAIILFFSASVFLVDWWYNVRELEDVGQGITITMWIGAFIFFIAALKLTVNYTKMRLKETEVN